MASRNLSTAVATFATLDTRNQLDILKRVGIETVVADQLLGNVRANYPERWTALLALDPTLGEVS